MTAILDTSFLLAVTNSNDINHSRVLQIIQTIKEPLILPVPVLPEVSYLIGSRLGYPVLLDFLQQIITHRVLLENLTHHDLKRTTEIMREYQDSRLDFVDASITAIAERLNITRILTLDQRDFSIIRPRHHTHFEILPE